MRFEFIDAIECPKTRDECGELLAPYVSDEELAVIPVEEFAAYISISLKNIRHWAKGDALPEEVVQLMRARRNRERLKKIQQEADYTYLHILLWVGEMKLQIMERRPETSQALGHQACSVQAASPHNLKT